MTQYSLHDKADLARVRNMVRDDAEGAGGGPTAILDCLVSVTEACTNALLYGRDLSNDRDPEVTWEMDGRAARFVVRDFAGRPPPPEKWWMERTARATTEAKDMTVRHGGFGLNLMRSLMDEVDIHSGSEGTTVVLVKHWT